MRGPWRRSLSATARAGSRSVVDRPRRGHCVRALPGHHRSPSSPKGRLAKSRASPGPYLRAADATGRVYRRPSQRSVLGKGDRTTPFALTNAFVAKRSRRRRRPGHVLRRHCTCRRRADEKTDAIVRVVRTLRSQADEPLRRRALWWTAPLRQMPSRRVVDGRRPVTPTLATPLGDTDRVRTTPQAPNAGPASRTGRSCTRIGNVVPRRVGDDVPGWRSRVSQRRGRQESARGCARRLS